MNYELAQKLKEAGFPPPKINGDFAINNETLETVPIPSLSELIEACGGGYFRIENGRDNNGTFWRAVSGLVEIRGEGKTPEESVSNLWLELNKK